MQYTFAADAIRKSQRVLSLRAFSTSCLRSAAVTGLFSAERTSIMSSHTQKWQYPEVRRDDSVVDNYHGTSIADPYRSLEDPDAKETQEFVEAQNDLSVPYINGSSVKETYLKRYVKSKFSQNNYHYKSNTKNRLVSGLQPLEKETRSARMKLFLDTFFGSSIVVLLMNKSTYSLFQKYRHIVFLKNFKFGWSFLRIFSEYCSGPSRNYCQIFKRSDSKRPIISIFYARSDHRFYVV